MSNALDDLKLERERFVAFAFASAEIFLETDSDGVITFSGGASDFLSSQSVAEGQNIFDLVADDHGDFLKVVYQHLDHRVRMGPVPIVFGHESAHRQALRLFALRMPGPSSRTFLALRSAPLGFTSTDDGELGPTGLLSKDGFLSLAGQTMHGTNSNLFVTVAEVDGLDDAQKTLGKRGAERLLKKVAAHLRALSIDGTSASQIDDKRFAFLHKEKHDGKHLGRSLEGVDDTVALSTKFTTVARDAKLDEDQIIRTLSYILAKFSEDPASCDFSDLAEAYDSFAAETQTRVDAMRRTIDSGFFKMAFQPIVSLRDGGVHHHEMLARFSDNQIDDKPEQIIRFAEDLGMIGELDAAVFDKAVDYVRKMKKLGTFLSLSVNLSGRTLDGELKYGGLADKLKAAKDVARHFLLELTETKAIKDIAKAEKTLAGIKDLGYSICLDDFGSGASGYQYLRAFKVDFVKIDGDYIREMGTDQYNPSFLMSIVRLCSDLGIKTVGEHVETRIQADFLKAVGVDYGQGFFFGRPADAPLNVH